MPKKAVEAHLTARELEVLLLLTQSRSNQQIAEALHISVNTAEFHVSNILRKLDVKSRWQAAGWAKKHGLGSP